MFVFNFQIIHKHIYFFLKKKNKILIKFESRIIDYYIINDEIERPKLQ